MKKENVFIKASIEADGFVMLLTRVICVRQAAALAQRLERQVTGCNADRCG